MREYLLCGNCEQRLGRFEKQFSERIFLPYQQRPQPQVFAYDEWLLRFVVGLHWRVLALYPKSSHPVAKLFASAESEWRQYLLEQAPNPGTAEFHIYFVDVVAHSTFELPRKFNWYIARSIDASHIYNDQGDAGELRRQTHGSGLVHVTKPDFIDTRIAIPPLAEQSRIVAKIDQLVSHLDSARNHLSRVPAIIKRFRKAVLAAACSGRLTEDWRDERLEVSQSKVSDGIAGNQNSDDQSLRNLPSGWTWALLSSLGADPKGTVQTGPFGAQLHRDEFTTMGIPVIAVGNLTGMGFTTDGLYYISEQKAQQLAKYDVQAGDVLFATRITARSSN